MVIGNYCQTLTVIRSLAKEGCRVVLGCGERRVFTQYSRYTSETWRHPDIKKSEARFITALANYLAEHKEIDFVFPVGDIDILCLMRHRGSIPSSVQLVMADPAAIETCLNKFRMYQVASQAGIPGADFRGISEYSELALVAERIGYPCVVKPTSSQTTLGGKKALIVETAADLRKLLPAWPIGHESLVVQKFASGVRHNCHFVADKGLLLAYFEQRVLRTDELDGTGYGADGISYAPTSRLWAYCALLAEELNYSGIGCAQFLVDDRSGSISFLEINPRLDATCALPFYCGYDFPRLALLYAQYKLGALSAPPANSAAYPVGKRGVSLWRDIQGWAHAVTTQDLSMSQSMQWLAKMAVTFFRGDFHLTWSWKDSLPTCYRFPRLASAAINHLVRKIGRGHRPARG